MNKVGGKVLLPSPVFEDIKSKTDRKEPTAPSTPVELPVQIQSNSNFRHQQQHTPYERRYVKNLKFTQYNSYNNASEEHKILKGFEFWCERCDIGHKNMIDLKSHESNHKTCNIDGCTFVANEAIVLRHIEQQHVTGLYNSMKKTNTPEEIAKWREERRKNYPTRANILLRQKIQEEKQKRGERLSNIKPPFSDYGKNKFKQNKRPEENLKHRKPRRTCQVKDKWKKVEETTVATEKETTVALEKEVTIATEKEATIATEEKGTIESENEERYRNIRKFGGTSTLKDYVGGIKETNALTSILGLYGSDDEESYDSDEINSPKHDNVIEKSALEENQTSESDKAASDNLIQKIITEKDCEFGEQPTKSVDVSLVSQPDDSHSSDDEAPDEIPFKKEEAIHATTDKDDVPEKVPCEKQLITSGECLPDSPAITHTEKESLPTKTKLVNENEPEKSQTNRNKNRKRRRRNSTTKHNEKINENIPPVKRNLLNFSKLRKAKPSTILEKLLQNEIVHERNILLQCVRFVVENNFFDIK